MKISDAYKPQSLIGRYKEERKPELQVLDDFKEFKFYYGKDTDLANLYLDKIEKTLTLYENKLKYLEDFYKEYRRRISDAIRTETSLNRKQYGTEAGLMQARNMLDIFFYENQLQTDISTKKDRIVSYSSIRENLEILRQNAKEDIAARIDVILGLLSNVLEDVLPDPDPCYDDADNNNDSAIRDEFEYGFLPETSQDITHGEDEEIVPPTKIMSTKEIKPDAMVPNVLYLVTDDGDNVYADVKFVNELPRDFRDQDLYKDTLFVLVDEKINEDNDKFIVQTDEPTEESESGFYIVRERDPSETDGKELEG